MSYATVQNKKCCTYWVYIQYILGNWCREVCTQLANEVLVGNTIELGYAY